VPVDRVDFSLPRQLGNPAERNTYMTLGSRAVGAWPPVQYKLNTSSNLSLWHCDCPSRKGRNAWTARFTHRFLRGRPHSPERCGCACRADVPGLRGQRCVDRRPRRRLLHVPGLRPDAVSASPASQISLTGFELGQIAPAALRPGPFRSVDTTKQPVSPETKTLVFNAGDFLAHNSASFQISSKNARFVAALTVALLATGLLR